LPLPQITTQHHHLGGRPERRRQQTIAVQPLQPLTIMDVGLGPARHMPRLPWINQEHLEAAGLQQLKQRNPVDARRFHSDGLDPALLQPIGQANQVRRAGAKAAHVGWYLGGMIGARRRSGLGWHGHPVLAGVNVDPGGLRVGHMQAFTRRGLTKVLLSARRHSGLHNSRDRGKTQRPQAREAFVNCSFPTGDTRGRATNDVSATPGARLTIGHAAPFRPRPPRPAALPPTVSQHATPRRTHWLSFLSDVVRPGRITG
jgi:hypothetical protein